MASQRHKLWEQGATAAGEIHAQGVVAPGIAMQVEPTELNVLTPGPALFNTGLEWKEPLSEGEVEVPIGEPGGPLSGSSLTGAIPEDLGPPPEPPEPDVAPVLTSLDPDGSLIGDGDITVTITGTGFTSSSVMVWNGADDVAEFVDETTMTTTVKTDLATVASVCTVTVRNGDQVSNELSFEFVEPTEGAELEDAEREFPIGPSNIGLVTDHEDGLEIGLIDAIDVQVGDTVRIEATGNTSVNGEYTVESINPLVVDNIYTLDVPIENKGRLTVLAGA